MVAILQPTPLIQPPPEVQEAAMKAHYFPTTQDPLVKLFYLTLLSHDDGFERNVYDDEKLALTSSLRTRLLEEADFVSPLVCQGVLMLMGGAASATAVILSRIYSHQIPVGFFALAVLFTCASVALLSLAILIKEATWQEEKRLHYQMKFKDMCDTLADRLLDMKESDPELFQYFSHNLNLGGLSNRLQHAGFNQDIRQECLLRLRAGMGRANLLPFPA